jgi:hypothetical protein
MITFGPDRGLVHCLVPLAFSPRRLFVYLFICSVVSCAIIAFSCLVDDYLLLTMIMPSRRSVYKVV